MGDKKPKLGTGNRKGFVQRPGFSHTSPARIKLWRKRNQALDLREQNLSYREIGRRMGCSKTLAQQLVIGALQDGPPLENRLAMRTLELNRLERLMKKYFPLAEKGDIPATKIYLRVATAHNELAGLANGDQKQSPTVNIDINTAPPEFTIISVPPPHRDPMPEPPLLEHQSRLPPPPAPEYAYNLEPSEPAPVADNVVQIAERPRTIREKRDALAERSQAEKWTADSKPGNWQGPGGPHGWMR